MISHCAGNLIWCSPIFNYLYCSSFYLCIWSYRGIGQLVIYSVAITEIIIMILMRSWLLGKRKLYRLIIWFIRMENCKFYLTEYWYSNMFDYCTIVYYLPFLRSLPSNIFFTTDLSPRYFISFLALLLGSYPEGPYPYGLPNLMGSTNIYLT